MKKILRYTLVGLVLAVAIGLLAWHPWTRASLEVSTVELPALKPPPPGEGDLLVVIYSGDGGWWDLDQRLGAVFTQRGVPVAGISTFKYFWRYRSPEESAHDLDRLLDKYTAQWNKHRVLLIGYSFGADVLPTIVNRLRPDNRARLNQLVLLSGSRDVNFEIELEGYMQQGWWTTHTHNFLQWINPVVHTDAIPPIAQLGGRPPMACYYGEEDADDSVCTDPRLPAFVTVYKEPGSHHFDENYEKLATQLIQRMPASASTSP
ncbi:AcvB/VirJ family lysyl-phosphatidylglycerol hydrolase [Luteibacter sp. PPL201]|uniref:AcvB/VirJ family lysyl-phosphatidylglycerol hydrolase n=1 Tax=Luteibacter sahnii TaxID=3021977 RepID=A0ABT6BEF7_9GAMM|nr:AcvB/VirJ family lysyl-phosphatidylglycerol hydrolase [Luteibacter sp. PPL193]MDY1549783.1 virulence protein [Luteibacter sp. PPL193]